MTTPGGNKTTYDVVVNFQTAHPEVLDAALKKTEHIVDVEDRAKATYKAVADEVKKLNPELYAQAQATEKAAQAQEHYAKAQAQALKDMRLQIRDLRAQAKEIVANNRLLLDSAQDIDRFAKPLFTGGLLITGGIFAAANKYVKDAKVATATTIEWKAAQESLNKSGEKIGAVLAEQALPILKEAAQVTSQIAGFLRANPEVAGAALKGGLIAVTFGAIGKAVSGGIRLYADFKMDAALELQFKAAQLQVTASEMQLEAAGIKSPIESTSRGAGASNLGTITLVAASVIIGAELGVALGNKLGSLVTGGKTGLAGPGNFGLGDAAVAGLSLTQTPGFLFIQGLNKLGLVTDETVKKQREASTGLIEFTAKLLGANKILNVITGLRGDSPSAPPTFLGGSQDIQDKIVADYEKFVNESAAITKAGEDKRKTIIADTEQAIIDITKKANAQREQINQTYAP